MRNTIEQLKLVGPRSLGVALLTAGFVGMVFTIQARMPLLHRICDAPCCGFRLRARTSWPRQHAVPSMLHGQTASGSSVVMMKLWVHCKDMPWMSISPL